MNLAVFGIGNVLHRDDGFGPTVVRTFRAAYELPEGLEVEDLGTPGGDLVSHLTGFRSVVVVDTVRAEGKPGALRRYDARALLRHSPQPRVNAHDPGLKEALEVLELAGDRPREIVLIGAIPASVEQGAGLTPPVRAAVGRALEAVANEVHRLGATVTRRARPLPADLWWEEPVPSA
ncbi:MAG: hydrogenase maturation protease [Acidobacteriota bacterium]|jgi:hydrogenase maturation protease